MGELLGDRGQREARVHIQRRRRLKRGGSVGDRKNLTPVPRHQYRAAEHAVAVQACQPTIERCADFGVGHLWVEHNGRQLRLRRLALLGQGGRNAQGQAQRQGSEFVSYFQQSAPFSPGAEKYGGSVSAMFQR